MIERRTLKKYTPQFLKRANGVSDVINSYMKFFKIKLRLTDSGGVLCGSPNIVRVINSRKLIWACHVARMEENKSAFKILTGKPIGKTFGEA